MCARKRLLALGGTLGQQAPYEKPQFSNWGPWGFGWVTHGPQTVSLSDLAAHTARPSLLALLRASLLGALVSGACLARGCGSGPGPVWVSREGGKVFWAEEFICCLAQDRVDFSSLHWCDLQVFGQALFSGRTAGSVACESCEIGEERKRLSALVVLTAELAPGLLFTFQILLHPPPALDSRQTELLPLALARSILSCL